MTHSAPSLSHGVVPFLRKLRSKGLRGAARSLAYRLAPWREWIAEKYLERRLGISTTGDLSAQALGHRHPAAQGYMPTFYLSNLRILDSLRIQEGRDVFIDIGSGKGRVLVLAAMRPFGKVIGVEFSALLNEIARSNIASARRWLKCANVELVTGDASCYEIPDDANVLYMANPFSGEILQKVLESVRMSLVRKPRPISLISHGHAPIYPFEQQVRACPWLEACVEVQLPCGGRAWIYANRILRDSSARSG